jgi:succinoglycan biosynthesis transport protein ExoP
MFGDRNNVLIEPPAPAAPVSGLPGGHGPAEGEVHLLDRLSVIYRYRKIVITVILVVLIAGVVQTMTTTPEYRATASVQVDDERGLPGVSTMEQVYQDTAVLMATQVQALRSKDLIRTIVGPNRLNLGSVPEFNGQDVAPTGFGGAIASIRERVMRPIRGIMGSAETPAQSAGAGAVAPPSESRLMEDALVDRFLAHLNTSVVTESRAITIDFVSRDPVLAAAAANALANAYIEQNLKRRRGSLDETVLRLKTAFDQVAQNVQKAEQDMLDFRQNQNASALADPGQLASQEYVAQAEYEQTAAAAQQSREDYEALKDVPFNDPKIDTFTAMHTDQQVANWSAQLKQKASALGRLRVGPGHPEYVAAQQLVTEAEGELKRARELVKERLRNKMVTDESVARAKQRVYTSLQTLRNSMGTKGIDYSSLERARDSQAEALKDLQTNLANASIQAGAIQNNVFLQDSAVAPTSPFKPDASRNLLIALFVGFALAGALAFGLDYLDDTIKTPEDITRKLRIPFLGLVPSVRGDKQPVLSGPVPHDFGEAYRALRTSLVFTSGGESTRIITCTSAQPLEGKTTTACNLAMVLAFGGSRVLLIDADMRRPGVHKALKINNTVGLSHLLVGQARVREAIQRTSDPNFCVMTAGRTPPNPSELLSSERMKQLIANLKQGPFDWVVIDTPPVLAVTDAVILTPLVDGVTFVLGAEMTRRRLAERAVQMLMVSRPKVVGAVLNRVNFDRNKYYYSRYYGYQYKSYYGSSSSGSTVKA